MVHKTLSLSILLAAFLCAPAALFAAKEGKVTIIKSVDQFNELYESNKPMVTMYTATWCGPCESTKPHFIALAKEIPEVNFCIVDFNKFENTLIKKARIGGVPTFKFSHKGKPVTFSSNGRSISSDSGGMGKGKLRKLITAFKTTYPKN